MLYNCYGDIIAEFGRNIDQIVISPDHLRFIATRSGINPSDTLYIFNMNGDIITSFYSKDPAVSFTKDSRYVIVKEFGKNIISVFTADGDFILNTNTWVDHEIGLIFSSFIIDNQKRLLLSTCLPDKQMSYIDFNNKLLWKQQFNNVLDLVPINATGNLLVLTKDDNKSLNETKTSIKIISLANGEVIDACGSCSLIKYFENNIIIKKGGTYYVYKYI